MIIVIILTTIIMVVLQVGIQVTVYVEDVNDHPPVFLAQNITVEVDELTPVGELVEDKTVDISLYIHCTNKPNINNSQADA